jgi:amidase
VGITPDSLPIAVQLGGHAGRDNEVLALSRQLEEALPWQHRRAPRYHA